MEISLSPVACEPAFWFDCERCGHRFLTIRTAALARLEGPPFRAYWCAPCATRARRSRPDGSIFYKD